MLFTYFVFRCVIPECEFRNTTDYYQDWLKSAIPFKNGRPEKCSRYATLHQSNPGQCPTSLFNQSEIVNCNEFVYKSNEYRIMREVRR